MVGTITWGCVNCTYDNCDIISYGGGNILGVQRKAGVYNYKIVRTNSGTTFIGSVEFKRGVSCSLYEFIE